MSLTALAIALSLAATPIMAAPLAQLQWDKRVLVLIAEAEKGDLGRQLELLQQAQDGLAERDMVVLALRGNAVQAVIGDAPGVDAQALRTSVGSSDAGAFEAVLIGKDGGVKQRWAQPVSTEELFSVIDAMPMRASEMQRSEK
jgi:glutathione peroxidase-family protein